MLLIFLITGSFSALWAVNNDTDNQSLLEYKLINNKELSVRHANGSIEGKVVIPERAEVNGQSYPVTRIADRGFSYCRNITELHIPNTVYQIGSYAFEECDKLTQIIVSDNNPYLKSVDGIVFSKSGKTIMMYPPGRGDTEYHIPVGVDSVGAAFYHLVNQMAITIPKSVLVLQRGAFSSPKITSLTVKTHFPPLVEYLSLYYSPTVSPTLYVPTGALENYQSADGWNKLTKMIEMDMDDVEDDPFEFVLGKDSKVSVKAKNDNVCGKIIIPSTTVIDGVTYPVTKIASGGFRNRRITEVTIPASITTLDSYAFYGCTAIKSVTASHFYPVEFNNNYCVFDDIYRDATLYVPIGAKEFYQDSESWRNFSNIEERDIEETDGNPFEYTIINENEVSVKARHTRIMGKVVIPSQVEVDGKTRSVTQIAARGFYGCSKVQEICIPTTLQLINNWAFTGCEKLERLTIDGESSYYKSVDGVLFSDSGKSLFRFPPAKVCDEYAVPVTVETICSEAFYQNVYLKSVVVPKSVTSIGNYAFRDCSSLTSMTLQMFYPLQVSFEAFGNNAYSMTFYIPTGSKSAYMNVDPWRSLSLQEVDMEGIDSYPLEFTIINEDYVSAKAKDQTVSGYIDIPDSVEIDGKQYAVRQIGRMTSYTTGITIPAHANYIEYGSLSYFNLSSITVRQFYPLGISNDTFSHDTYQKAILHVPTGSSNIYRNAEGWKLFVNIQEVDMEGMDSNPLIYTIEEDGVSITTRSYAEYIIKGKFEIPESVTIDGKTYPVTGIGQDAFKYCNELTELCIPKTVKNIPLRLIDCEHLERFSVAEGNETYKSVDGVLFSADGMTLHIYPCAKADEEYIIPEGVTSIGSFSGNTNIRSITIPTTLQSLSAYAFKDCNSLSSLIVKIFYPIYTGAFTEENYEKVTLYVPKGSLEIYRDMMYWKDFKNIQEMEMDGVDSNPFVFSILNGTEVTVGPKNKLLFGNIVIPEKVEIDGQTYTVTTIKSFSGCNRITEFRIPKSVNTISTYQAFYDCDKLQTFYVDEGNTTFRAIDGILFSYDGNTLSFYPPGKTVKEYEVPEGVTRVWSICSNKNLQKITLPNSVKSIGIISGCTSLASITMRVYYPFAIDYQTFSNETYQNATLTVPTGSIGMYKETEYWKEFNNIREEYMEGILTDPLEYIIESENEVAVKARNTGICGKIIIPQNVTIDGISYTVTKMANEAFSNCKKITEIVVPKTLTVITGVYNCEKLERLTVEEGNQSYQSIDGILFNSDGKELLFYPQGLTNEAYTIPEGVEYIRQISNDHLKTVVLPNSIKTINSLAFYGSKSLETITIPNSVTQIGENAFSTCNSLSSVIVKQANPLLIQENVFSEQTYNNATLFVPKNRSKYYKEAVVWRNFVHMGEIDMPDVIISDSPFANVEENQIILGYYTTDEYAPEEGGLGGSVVGAYKACVGYSSEKIKAFAGNQIKYVRFALADTKITDVNLWISSSREDEPLYKQAVGTVVSGWNEIKLDQAFDITDDSLFVGISFQQQDNETYPISCVESVESVYEEGAGYLYVPDYGWFDLAGYGCLSIQCLVEGDKIPQYNLHAVGISIIRGIGQIYFKADDTESDHCSLVLKNWGKRTIDEYEVRCEIDGKYIKTVKDGPINGSGYQQDYNMTYTGISGFMPDNLSAGKHTLKLSIESINGEAPLFPDDDVAYEDILTYAHDIGRQKLLMLHYTGTWCPNSPTFDTLIEKTLKENDDIVRVAFHYDDPLTCEAGDAYNVFTSTYPRIYIDRYAPEGADRLDASLEERRARLIPSFANVNITASYNPSTRDLHIKVYGNKNEDFNALIENTNLTVLLTEDNVVARQRKEGEGYVENYVHNDVLRTNVSEIWGDPIVWNGDKYEMTYSLKLDDAWKKDDMKVVAFIGKPFTGSNYDKLHVDNCNDFMLRNAIIEGFIRGDANGDGIVNASDIVEVVNYIIGRPSEKFIKDAADMNGDGDVNITDVDLIKNVIMTSQ